MKNKTQIIILAVLISLAQNCLHAKEMLIIAPYGGTITNTLNHPDYNLDLKDSAPMYGGYAQWINSEKFQGNIFYYKSSDINYSNFKGIHAIVDWYPKVTEKSKYVLGIGVEKIRVNMDAGSNLSGMTSFVMDNDILYYYMRAGQYRYFETGNVKGSLLPYIGYSYEQVDIDLEIDFINPFAPDQNTSITAKDRYPIAGLNLTTKFHHFVETKLKYMGRFEETNTSNVSHSVSALANFFITRNLGLSYRYKYIEHGDSNDKYHLVGLMACF